MCVVGKDLIRKDFEFMGLCVFNEIKHFFLSLSFLVFFGTVRTTRFKVHQNPLFLCSFLFGKVIILHCMFCTVLSSLYPNPPPKKEK